jgi:hypothetical protein
MSITTETVGNPREKNINVTERQSINVGNSLLLSKKTDSWKNYMKNEDFLILSSTSLN